MTEENVDLYSDCDAIVRVVLVGGLTKAELGQEFQKHSISMNELGKKLFTTTDFSATSSAYRLETVELTVSQLGFRAGATSQEIIEKATALGLRPCPLEAAPYLRLQYLDQPAGNWLILSSPGMTEQQADQPTGYYLRRLEDGLWLRGYFAAAQYVWKAADPFVFWKPGERDEKVLKPL